MSTIPTADDMAVLAPDLEREWTQDDVRRFYDRISDHVGEWQGVPIPLGADMPLVLTSTHPLAEALKTLGIDMNGATVERACSDEDVREDETIINHWRSRRRQADVWIVDRAGRRSAIVIPVSPDRSMERLTFWLMTLGASDAWDLAAERRARYKLAGMLTDRQWGQYDLTGSFLETSPRSGLTYMFRRLRPTLALSPRQRDGTTNGNMLCIAVLCLHPIGYYANSWGGCMVPSDDLIAHLLLMRGDEAAYWRFANQHDASSPEAGI